MTKILVFIFSLFVLSSSLFGDSLRVKLNPKEPVINTSFELVFTIETSSDEEPYITFDARGADVLGRRNAGISTSTTFFNGRLSTKREMSFIYELEAEKPGTLRITNIKAELGKQVLRANDIRTKILRESRKPKDVFVLAVPSKTSVYVGEGIDLVYYLYRRIGVGNRIVESYPKLNRFIKRFHILKTNREETVEFQGLAYRRLPVYSARIYAEKVGKAFIDPLKMKVDYAVNRNSGSMFGFGLRQMRTKSIRSRKIQIEVKPIPAENIPANFTGLVGEHDFTITTNKNKHLVNEAIEVKFIAEGEGALENYDAPPLYEHRDMEEFDTKAELSEIGKNRGRKVFDYTFLARAPLNIPSKTIRLSYFDPNSSSFVEKEVVVPALVVGGIASVAKSGTSSQSSLKPGKSQNATKAPPKVNSLELIAPVFYQSGSLSLINSSWLSYLNKGLLLLIIILLLQFAWAFKNESFGSDPYSECAKRIKRDGINYSNLYQFLVMLGHNEDGPSSKALSDIVAESGIKNADKNYFKSAIAKTEQETYKTGNKSPKVEYKEKHFKSVVSYLRRKNGSN